MKKSVGRKRERMTRGDNKGRVCVCDKGRKGRGDKGRGKGRRGVYKERVRVTNCLKI